MRPPASSARAVLSLRTYAELLAALKWTLTLRHFQRHGASAIAGLVGLGLMLLLLLGGMAGVAAYLHLGGEAQRDAFLFWTLWGGTLAWLLAPLGQLDLQRNIDLTGLRLFPLSQGRFALAVLLDAALSPLGVLSLAAGLGICGAFALGPGDIAALVMAVLLLGIFQLGTAQAVFLLANRVLTSRRFGDASMIFGLLFFLAIQFLNLLLQNGLGRLPPWLQATAGALHTVSYPAGQWLAPGVAARAVSAASQGWLLHASALYALLAAQAALALLAAGWAARMFYAGQIESGGTTAKARGRRRPVRPAGPSRGPLPALLWRERAYLWRDPLVKMQLIQSLFGTLYLAVVLIFITFRQGDDYFHARLDHYGKYLLLGLSLMLGLTESAVLFNKFGYEGGQVANLLVTPVPRRSILASKSLHLVAHFLPLNLALALMAAAALHAPPLYWALAGLLVVTNALLLDVIGQYVSIYFPFAYRRTGRRVRAVMPQPGCGYVLVYTLVFQLCHLLTAPVSAVSIVFTLMGGWAGFAIAVAWSAVVAWLGYRISLPDAAYRLQQREPQLLSALAKGTE